VPEAAQTETLAYERRTGRPWLPGVVAVAVLLVAGTAAVLDDRRGDAERSELARCARAAATALYQAENRLTAMARYIAPVVDPLRVSPTTDLYSLLSDAAKPSLPDVERAQALCLRVDVWWLHSGNRRARDGYVALLAAELDRLVRVVADGTAFYDGYDEIMRLRADAERALPD